MFSFRLFLLSLTTFTLLTSQVFASEDDFYTLDEVEIEEIDPAESDYLMGTKMMGDDLNMGDMLRLLNPRTMNSSLARVRGVIAVANELIAFGERVYEVVERGRPVYNSSVAPVSVLPNVNNGSIQAMDLENWSEPTYRDYRVTYKNAYGMKVVQLTYRLVFVHGGEFEGQGQYIAHAQIVPVNVSVAWGFTLNAEFKVDSIYNRGSRSNPVAGVLMKLTYSVSSVLSRKERVSMVSIDGTGRTQIMPQ